MISHPVSVTVPVGHRPSSHGPPFFLITIDTEGDNLWGTPPQITTQEYSAFLQRLVESSV